MIHAVIDGFRSWSEVVQVAYEIYRKIPESRCLFRGQTNSGWNLTPGIFRHKSGLDNETEYFAGFVACSQRHVPRDAGSWETLFYLQHHGGPTRLLDWTASFSTAAYFAIPSVDADFSIWILNAAILNQHAIDCEFLETYSRFGNGVDYVRDFLKGAWRPTPLAIKPPRFNPRIVAQEGYFTFTARNTSKLEETIPTAFTHLKIDRALRLEAKDWLRFLAIDRAILFPDADGLTWAMNETFGYK